MLALHQHTAKTKMSDELIFPNMYECFMNTKYLWTCLTKICYQFELQAKAIQSHACSIKSINMILCGPIN